ncbi:RWP-RK domain-containing protein, partial [Haematococcus lacustris]
MNDEEFGRLRQVFHLPREHAAKELNISMAKLKQLCQEHGIGRWPHRIIASLNQMRASLMEQPGRSQAEQQAGLATVETELQNVMLDPNHKVDAQLLAWVAPPPQGWMGALQP